MATSVRSNSFVYQHDNYSTTSSAATKTPANKPIDYLLISNVDSANDASISFDGGNNFITVKHGVSLELFPARMYSYQVQDASSGNHASLQCLYGSEA